MGNTCCCRSCRKRVKKDVCLLLLGLDNAGKTVAVKTLAGEPPERVVPTVGFSVVNLRYNGHNVKVYDLGGGPTIRGIWHRYFVDAHGIVFVVDSSDFSRLDEVREVLHGVLSHEKVSGKPVLVLANKQDSDDAMDELDLIETLRLEELVNRHRCPTLVESCCAARKQLDPGIRRGYGWLMGCVLREYEALDARVSADARAEELAAAESRREIVERLRAERQRRRRDDDVIELYSDYADRNGAAVRPFDDDPSSSDGERPRSATRAVKEQLELHRTVKRPPLRLRRNKTQPAHLCGAASSARTRRSPTPTDRRALRSAGDSVFVVANGGDVVPNRTGGGDLNQHLFQVKRSRFKHGRAIQGGDNAISVIEVD